MVRMLKGQEVVCAVLLQHSKVLITVRVIFMFNLIPVTSCLLLEHYALIKLRWF